MLLTVLPYGKWLLLLQLVILLGFSPIIVFGGSGGGAFVGFNVGTEISNPPSPSTIVSLLKSQHITHIRLLNTSPNLLHSLANTTISVTVTVTNQELYSIGKSTSVAASWVNKNILTYLPDTNITSIAVGSEVLTTIPHMIPILIPAMNNIHSALIASNLNFNIKVSTPLPIDIITSPFPPSEATFNTTWNSTIYQILQFLHNTDSHFMFNAYPYNTYTTSNGIFPLDYALFNPLPSVQQIVDPNTLFHYTSLFDSMLDAVYYSISSLNFTNIPIIVTETGWPSGSNNPDATIKNAKTYTTNLIRRVLNNSGPPSNPAVPISVYIYELYNEDLRHGQQSNYNYGTFFGNGTAVYGPLLNVTGIESNTSYGGVVYCVAKMDADEDKLKNGLDWACGQGKVDCKAIQQGHPCYEPDNIRNHASYAYNDYYQRMRGDGGTCDFDGTATISTTDPSYGSCAFTGSLSRNSGRGSMSAAFGPVVSPLQISRLYIHNFWFVSIEPSYRKMFTWNTPLIESLFHPEDVRHIRTLDLSAAAQSQDSWY